MRQIVTRTFIGPAATGLLCGLSAGLVVATIVVARTPAEVVVTHTPGAVIEHVTFVPMPIAVPVTAIDPRASELEMMLEVNHVSYLKLAEIGESGEIMPAHGKAKLTAGEGEASVVASLREADLPPSLRAWQGRKVVVDGTCQATVTGFAIVARLSGDPSYASKDKWDPASVLEQGAPIIAARLDHCTGTYARDAALPAVIVPTVINDEDLAKVAQAQLIVSTPAAKVQADWLQQGRTGHWYDGAELKTLVVKHPKTGVTFVSVHANIDEGCGGPTGNV